MQKICCEMCSFVCKICRSQYIEYFAFICTPHFADGEASLALEGLLRVTKSARLATASEGRQQSHRQSEVGRCE